jgi:hypothetical protein
MLFLDIVTPNNVKRYVIDPKTFMQYLTKVLQINSILLAIVIPLR